MEPSGGPMPVEPAGSEDPEPVTVYEPADRSIPPLGDYAAALWERRHFIWHLSSSELKAQHYNTTLGQAWNLLTPLLLAACYLLLLRVLRDGERGQADHVAALLSGLFFFFYTRNCLQDGSRSLVKGERYLLNAALPRMALPLAAVVQAFLKFVPTLLVYLLVHVLVIQEPVGAGFLLLPLLIVIQTVFNIGVTLTMAVLTVYVRDTSTAMPFITRLWIYVTPVLFLIEDIPDDLQNVFRANPLYPLFAALQRIVGGATPSPWLLLAASAWAAASLVVGVLLFVVRERDLAVRL